jgi:hypothetical protein
MKFREKYEEFIEDRYVHYRNSEPNIKCFREGVLFTLRQLANEAAVDSDID